MKSATPNTVLSHWHHPVTGFQVSIQEFYALLERKLQPHRVPGIFLSRIEWKEGGALSAHREYFRVKREKLTYDICAAPFGADFFFSSWLAEIPPKWGLLKMAGILFGMFVIFGILLRVLTAIFGDGFGAFIAVPLAVIAWPVVIWMIGNALRSGSFGPGAEDAVIETPFIGWCYVKLFGPATYYRMDTTLAFQSAVHSALLDAVEEVTAAKGIRPLTELERKPAMRGFLGG